MEISRGRTQYQLFEEGQALSFKHVLELWQSSASFRIFYNQLLASNSFEAYFWEHPPVSSDNLDQNYEFILIDSPTLARVTAEPDSFANYFVGEELAVTFANLRGDAQLVVPVALANEEDYPHLATFCRRAPTTQIHEFWAQVGRVVVQHLSGHPRWLSTSGLGVYWLHIRFDQRPKYYTHRAYTLK